MSSASSRVVPPRRAASRPSFADLVGELEDALRLRLRESPALTFAVAGGVGYALGGGLTVGVLARALQLGLRAIVANRAEQILADWVTMSRRTEDAR
ncbi:MAG: hypothetical protein ABW298_14795 [Candidatus Binatia bacterium]|jgi:hypothetical protein